jgi:hypothetical protein
MIERPQVCRRCNFRALCFPKKVPEGLVASADARVVG